MAATVPDQPGSFAASPGLAQQSTVVLTSAANFDPSAITPGAIVAAFGAQLATSTVAASSIPLPTELGGTTARVKDSANVERAAELFFVSPQQVNLLIPPETAIGPATITIRSGDGAVSSGAFELKDVAPAIFTANASGQGVPAANLIRVKADGTQALEAPFEEDPIFGGFKPRPIDLGPEGERLFLALFLTGIRRAADPNGDGNLNETIGLVVGGEASALAFAGAQGVFAGLDQANLEIPRRLLGRGRVSLALTSGGASSNLVEIEIASPPSSGATTVGSLSPTTILAAESLSIEGSGFASTSAGNLVRIGGVEALVTSATATRLAVTVPFGAISGPVSVNAAQGEAVSDAPLNVRTSISGLIETTARQPMPGVTVNLRGTQIRAATGANGSFLLPDAMAGTALLEIDASTLQTTPPYGKLLVKMPVLANRDNPYPNAVSLQQATGASATVGNANGFSAENRAAAPELSIQTSGVTFEIDDNVSALFPDGARSGLVTLTVVGNSRPPVPPPPGQFSSTIVQITPFGVKLAPGGRLIFPNTDALPAGSEATLFKLDQNPDSPTVGSFIAAGAAKVSADGARVETAAGAITETSIYFVSVGHETTTLVGRVVDSDGQTPVRLALARARGQETFTDGNGGFILREVPVRAAGETLTVEASFVRANGRVDRVERSGVVAVINGLTQVTPDLVLPAATSNRPPVVLAPDMLTVSRGEMRQFNLVVSDPDLDPVSQVSLSGAAFASLSPGSSPNVFLLTIAPGANDGAGLYTLTILATDNRGESTSQMIKLRVNIPPVAISQTIDAAANLPRQITLSGSDEDGDPLSFILLAPPQKGELGGSGAVRVYTPASEFSGSDSFTFKVNDGFADSNTATVTITVAPSGTIVRTLVYHQITSGDLPVLVPEGARPMLSASGERAVFVNYTDQGRLCRVYTINADGSGQREVAAVSPLGNEVQISGDGARVMVKSGSAIRVVDADGTNARDVIQIGNGESYFRLAPDGERVFFMVDRNFVLQGGAELYLAGLYVVNVDGSGLRAIATSAQIAALYGVTAAEVFPFSGQGRHWLDLSQDNSRLVFVATINAQPQILRVNFDGSGLSAYPFARGEIAEVTKIGISGNGAKIFYQLRRPGSAAFELAVMNYNGTERQVLAMPVEENLAGELTQLSFDGTRYNFGSFGLLFNTDGSGRLQISGSPMDCQGLCNPPNPSITSALLLHSTMKSDATRFLFVMFGPNGVAQLATLEIDPQNAGAAPRLLNPSITPAFVLVGGGSTATVRVQVETPFAAVRVGGFSLLDGLYDDLAPAPDGGRQRLFDDATNGDDFAGDRIYTNNRWDASSSAVVGPRTVRIRAEVNGLDGRRHAMAIDFTPFMVLSSAP